MPNYVRSGRRLWVFLLALAAIACTSCGSKGPKLYPVRGKVLFDGQPSDGASVIFVPVSSANDLKPTGKVGSDGSFSLQTYPHGDGAPTGDYIVLVTWYPPNARELDNPKNKLPDKYSDQSAALLKATVKAETNNLQPMRLTK